MSSIHNESTERPSTTGTPKTEGVCQDSFEVAFRLVREDWDTPVASLGEFSSTRRVTSIDGCEFVWSELKVPKLWLGHRASLLLLQGVSLSHLLVPCKVIVHGETMGAAPSFGHLVLRVDPWDYWRSRPLLTNVMTAFLNDVPAALRPDSVLSALAVASSS